MATRSTIGYETETGGVKVVYCHWDGAVQHNGRVLVEHYNSYDLAKTLVNMGNIAVLQPKISPIGEHSFERPERGTTVFYARDRGDCLVIKQYPSFKEYDASLRKAGQDFNYFYALKANARSGQCGWHLKINQLPPTPWHLLKI